MSRAIFNRCFAKPETTEKVSSILYYKELGYEKEDLGVAFDKNALIANRKNIEYLYGQIASVHESQSVLKETDFAKTYSGHLWTEDNAPMMQLIYLGISEAVKLLTLFNAAADGTALYAPVKPTLSPERPGVPGVVGGTQGGVGGLNSDRSYEIGDRSGCVPPLAERFKSVRRRRTPQLLSHISISTLKKEAPAAPLFSHHLSLSMSRPMMVPVAASISNSYSVQPLRISTSYSARPSSQSNWHL